MNVAPSQRGLEGSADLVVTVLAISSRQEDHAALQEILGHSNWVMFQARDCRQAVQFLGKHPAGVIVCDYDLPDGTWQDIQSSVSALEAPPPVIVSACQADDRVWAEVLSLGGYDVLPKPFDSSEVVRILGLAWRHWKDTCRRSHKAHAPAMALAGAV
jgi:DNA-binding NtrC family response regulator